MDAYDTAALIRVLLAWTGAGVGALMALGALGAALNAWIEGRSRPFAKGQSEWWLSIGFTLLASAVCLGCLWYIFLSDRAPVAKAHSFSPAVHGDR